MQDQIAKEDARREGHHKWLKEMANNVLPFIILRTQLEELKTQIALEHKAQVDANVKSTIDTPEIKSIISGVLSRANIELADDISEKVIYEIASYASHTSQITPILNLSDFDRFELTAKINSLLAYDTNRVKEATDDIMTVFIPHPNSRRRSRKLRSATEHLARRWESRSVGWCSGSSTQKTVLRRRPPSTALSPDLNWRGNSPWN